MKIGIFVTHPVQYQVPVWKGLAQIPDWRVEVFYFSDQGVSSTVDPGFGKEVTWDTPMLEGYKHQFLSRQPIQEQINFKIPEANFLFEKEDFDVVLLHGYTHAFARQVIRLKHKHHYKVILRGEFTDMPRRPGRLKNLVRNLYLHWFYRYVDHFCPIGLDANEHLEKRSIPESQMTVTPYSVDDQYFESQRLKMSRAECREFLGIKPHDLVFLFSGKLMSRKQPLLLAAAVEKLFGEYPQIVVVYLGDGEQFDKLKSHLNPLLGNRFIAPGFVNQSELGRYFRAADVFILPSNYDTWGLVVNEAMHFGLPCVTSDRVGSRRDLVISNETGFIFHFDDMAELVGCMQHFLDRPGEAGRMGEQAHKHIQKFTISATVQGLTAAIKSVAKQEAATSDA